MSDEGRLAVSEEIDPQEVRELANTLFDHLCPVGMEVLYQEDDGTHTKTIIQSQRWALPCGMVNDDKITQQMVDDFITDYHVSTLGEKTTVVHAKLKNGFELVESSACVDPANYDEQVGAEICLERIRNQVWHLLGFALQWARMGLDA